MTTGRYLQSIWALWGTVLLIACGAEKPAAPTAETQDYRLYLSEINRFTIFSAKSGDVLDSFYFSAGARTDQNLLFTKDGHYKCIALRHGLTAIWIEDTRTGETLATRYANSGVAMVLSADESELLVTGSGVMLLRMPNLDLIFEDEFGSVACLHPSTNQLFYMRGHEDSTLYQVDFTILPPQVVRRFLRNNQQLVIRPIELHCSLDGKYLMVSNQWHRNALLLFDLPDMSLEREFEGVFYAKISDHATANQVCLLENRGWSGMESGQIDLLDLGEMRISPLISESHLPELTSHWPMLIAYTPDRNTGFLLLDRSQGGGIFSFNPKTMIFEQFVYRSYTVGFRYMAIDPRPISD